jgi:hypothetical protein
VALTGTLDVVSGRQSRRTHEEAKRDRAATPKIAAAKNSRRVRQFICWSTDFHGCFSPSSETSIFIFLYFGSIGCTECSHRMAYTAFASVFAFTLLCARAHGAGKGEGTYGITLCLL